MHVAAVLVQLPGALEVDGDALPVLVDRAQPQAGTGLARLAGDLEQLPCACLRYLGRATAVRRVALTLFKRSGSALMSGSSTREEALLEAALAGRQVGVDGAQLEAVIAAQGVGEVGHRPLLDVLGAVVERVGLVEDQLALRDVVEVPVSAV